MPHPSDRDDLPNSSSSRSTRSTRKKWTVNSVVSKPGASTPERYDRARTMRGLSTDRNLSLESPVKTAREEAANGEIGAVQTTPVTPNVELGPHGESLLVDGGESSPYYVPRTRKGSVCPTASLILPDNYADLPFFSPPPHILRGMNQSTLGTRRALFGNSTRPATSPTTTARHSQPPSPSPETCIDEESSEFNLSDRLSPVHTSAREAVSDREVCGFMYTPESAHLCFPADPSAQGTIGPGWVHVPARTESGVKTARSSSYDSLHSTQLSTAEDSDARWTRSPSVATARDLSASPIRTARSGYEHNASPDSVLCEQEQSQFAYQKTPNGYTQTLTHSAALSITPSAPLYDMRTPRTARASAVSPAPSLLRSPVLSSDVATAVDGVSNSDNSNEDVAASPRLTTARHWAAAAANKPVAANGTPQVIVRANQGDGKVHVEVSLSFKLNTTGTIRVRGEMPPGLHPRAVSVNGQQIWFDPSRQ